MKHVKLYEDFLNEATEEEHPAVKALSKGLTSLQKMYFSTPSSGREEIKSAIEAYLDKQKLKKIPFKREFIPVHMRWLQQKDVESMWAIGDTGLALTITPNLNTRFMITDRNGDPLGEDDNTSAHRAAAQKLYDKIKK